MNQNYIKNREQRLSYSRGYSAGIKCIWPEHRPPAPPEDLINGFYKAAMALRNAADNICASIDEEDEFAKELSPKIDNLDMEFKKLTLWLSKTETFEI